MSKKLPNRKKVKNILAVTTKFYTNKGWPWCRTRVYVDGWPVGVSPKYAGSGNITEVVLERLKARNYVAKDMDFFEFVFWKNQHNIHTEVETIYVGRLKDL